MKPPDRNFGNPFEETNQVEIADNQHHREKQDNRTEIDKEERIRRIHHPERKHQNRADNGCARPVDLHAGKVADRKNQIAA